MKALPILIISIASASLGTAAEAARAPEMPERPVQPSDRVRPVSEGPQTDPRKPGGPRPPNFKRETVTHLGVGVAPAGPSLDAQLGLAPHTGLVVTEVAPNGPAQEKIKLHDVLVELDGQVLINPEQFAVLIRNHRAGDEVTLKLIRGSKPEMIKVQLATHEIPLAQPGPSERGARPEHPRVVFPGGIPMPGQPQYMERRIEVNPRNVPGDEAIVRQRRFVLRDQAGSIEVTNDERGRSVVVKGVDGETVFSGPLNSPADFAAVPEAIRPRLEKLPQGRGPTGPPGRE